jgi:c-di-GMP-binding flagellar brake protein YcgR
MSDSSPSSLSSADPSVAAGIEAGSAAAQAILSDDEYSKYLLHTKNEIFPVLKRLAEEVAQVTMFFNGGRDMVITSIVSFDNDFLILDFGPSGELNRKALAADRLFCISQLDKVKIQFLLRGVTQVDDGGRPAFQTRRPENMLRLQRREFFRMTLPITRPLNMKATLKLASGANQSMDIQVCDISGGGLSIVNLDKAIPIESGLVLESCRLDLPEVGMVTCTLKVCSVQETVNRSGASFHRAGCEFVKLAGPMSTLIQRYIIKMERERKARESGLA